MFLHFVMQSVDNFKRAFTAKITLLDGQKGHGSNLISRNKYDFIVHRHRLKELSSNSEIKRSSQDYRMLKRYEMSESVVDGGA